MIRSSYLPISFIAAFYVASFTYFITFSTSTLAFSLLILIVGLLFSYLITNKQQRPSAIAIFNITYCVYVLLALNHFLAFQADWIYFAQDWRDEYKFYVITQQNELQTISQIFNDTFITRDYIEYGLYVFYISSIASLAHNFFDGNHLLIQFLGTSLFGIFTSVVVFKILWMYVSDKKAYIYTLFFMFFSLFSIYSFKLLRDPAIAFFFTVGIYLVLSPVSKNKIYKLILLLLINWIVWELRFENGIIFSLFTIYYYYKAYGKSKIAALSGLLAVAVVVAGSIKYFYKALDTIDRYSRFTSEESAAQVDSLGAAIYELPPGILHIAAIVNSQIQPFPPWNKLDNINNFYLVLENILQIASSLFWFVIFTSLVKWILLDRKLSRLKSTDLKFMALVCLVFFIASTSNISHRRIMAFYPFIFLVYTLVRTTSVSHRDSQKTVLMSVCLYVFLIVIYYMLKL